MPVVPEVALPWLVQFVNEYSAEPRAVRGQAAAPYRDLHDGQPDAARAVSEHDRVVLADTLWPLFTDVQPADRAAPLNALLAAGALTPQLDAAGAAQWHSPHTDPAAVLAAGCAAAMLRAVHAHGWHRLGVCAGVDCVDVFIDQQRRTARRYCSATCLNRARIRAYRARQ